jgi:hypothetical protein
MVMDLKQATNDIAEILKQLEIDTGQLVKGIALETTEITGLTDTVRVFGQLVVIDLERIPGNQWTIIKK